MDLSKVVSTLNEICHLNLAENWDNVGLLSEPTAPLSVSRVMLGTELSESVVDEAISSKADLVLIYQPPIFTPIKRITQVNWRERNLIRCLENRIAVYSPHTSLDSREDGINDWLLSPFKLQNKVSVTPPAFVNEDIFEVTTALNDQFRKFSLALPLAPIQADIKGVIGQMAKFKYPKCQKEKVEEVAAAHGIKFLSKEIIYRPNPMASGAGRVAMLEKPVILNDILNAYKNLLGTKVLQICLGNKKTLNSPVSTIAVCAGSGGGMLTRQAPAMLADLMVTGEATHHEQQEIMGRGTSLILIGQHKIERSFLNVKLQPQISQTLNGVEVFMSKNDKGGVEIC